MGVVFSDPSLDGPNLDIHDQTISPLTGYGSDLGTITGGAGSAWSLTQWKQRGVITPQDIRNGTGVKTDRIYGRSIYNFRKADGSEGLAIYRDPATGAYVYNLAENSNDGGIAGESDLFLQVGAPTTVGPSFANPLTLTFDAKLIQADARYNVAAKNDPASPAAQVNWGTVALFDQPGGPCYQVFLSGGITDSRFGKTPVPYSLEIPQVGGATQVLFNSTEAGSAPIDYFATEAAPRSMSFSLTGALEQAILSLGLDAGQPGVDDLSAWSLNGFYVGIESQTGSTGPNSLTTEIQLSNIRISADMATVLRPEDTRAGAQLREPGVTADATGFNYIDVSSGLSGSVGGAILAANQYGIEALYAYSGSDDVGISATRPNVMIVGGSGLSVLASAGGTNVLDAGTGDLWLRGCPAGAGNDTFEAVLAPGQSRWVGIANFHAGEWSLVYDVLPGAATWAWSDESAYIGHAMMALDIKGGGGGKTSLNFDGMTPADLGHLDTSAKHIGGHDVLQVTYY